MKAHFLEVLGQGLSFASVVLDVYVGVGKDAKVWDTKNDRIPLFARFTTVKTRVFQESTFTPGTDIRQFHISLLSRWFKTPLNHGGNRQWWGCK